jgi:acetyl esterase
MGLSYKHLLYGAITFISLLTALLVKGAFGTAVSAWTLFYFTVFYFIFLAWAGGQLWTIHSREQRDFESEPGGIDIPLPEADRPNEETLLAAETYLGMGENLETICQFVNPQYRNWDPSQKSAFRQNLNALLAERQSRQPEIMLSEKLDPNVRLLLQKLAAQGRPALETLPPVEARKAAAEGIKPVAGDPETVASVENLRIPGPEGEIPIRVYTPEAEEPRPAMVYFHGGGWVVCDLDTHDGVCRAIARRAGAVVVAVDYRLAPDHKFPAAVTDAYAATEWVAANAERFGIDPGRISVGGDSAGGNLGTVVSLMSREKNGPPIALQALVYPVTDLSSFETPSYREFAKDHHLSRAQMEWFRGHYLANPADGGNPYASPLLARDLRGLPPALIITAECDPLRDEGEAYATRLEEAGVTVTCTRYPGMIHPFLSQPGAIPQALDAIQQVADAVRMAGRS